MLLTCNKIGLVEGLFEAAEGATCPVQQRTGWARELRVRVAGKGVVSHVGSALLRLLGDTVGLTAALSKALTVRGFHPDIDRAGCWPTWPSRSPTAPLRSTT